MTQGARKGDILKSLTDQIPAGTDYSGWAIVLVPHNHKDHDIVGVIASCSNPIHTITTLNTGIDITLQTIMMGDNDE
jgi:hypothetical protein